MKAIILAAGFGTRLYPLTRNIPKALLQLGEKTILDHLVSKLENLAVVDEIILIVNGRFYLDFYKWHEESLYEKPIHIVTNDVFQPEDQRGAVKDLDLALRSGYCGSDDFLVFCGDNYFDFPLGYFMLPVLGHCYSAFVGIYDVKDSSVASDYGVVELDSEHRVISFEEKPADPKSTKISVGVYFLPSAYRLRIYEYLSIDQLNPDRIGDFIAWLSRKDPVYGVEFHGAWFDIGSQISYEAARRFVDERTAA